MPGPDEPSRSGWRFVARTLVALVTGTATAIGAVGVAARALGFEAGPLYVLVALTPYLGLGMLAVALVWALLRRWWPVALSCGLAAVVAVWWIPVFVPSSNSEDAPTDVQVMTANLQFGRAEPAAVVAAVREHGVDLLSLQELTPQALLGLSGAGLDGLLPYHYARAAEGSGGTGIWSRYPLRDMTHSDGLAYEDVAATVDLSRGPVRFVGMHMPAPPPWDGNHNREIYAAGRQFLGSAPGAAIAGGDLNATRDHAFIRDLEGDGWIDGAAHAGAGLVRTWPNGGQWVIPPLFGIDHVLTRGLPGARELTVIILPGTDHRALIAEL